MSNRGKPNFEALLKEYDIINNKTQFIENLVWKTFSLIGLISITLLLSDKIIKANISFETIQLLGALSVGLTIIWWRIAERWWDIQGTLYARSRHIEKKTGMASNIYINICDGAASIAGNVDSKIKYSYEYGKKGVQKYFSFLLPMIWIAWFLKILSSKPRCASSIRDSISYLFEEEMRRVLFLVFIVELICILWIFAKKQIATQKMINLNMLRSIKNDEALRKAKNNIIDNKKILRMYRIRKLVRKSQTKEVNAEINELLNEKN
jgi:hypothetical protein